MPHPQTAHSPEAIASETLEHLYWQAIVLAEKFRITRASQI
ncbi:MAG: hypothetical protein ACO3NK_16140 [Prochlorotrichaceae cyanobacterium]